MQHTAEQGVVASSSMEFKGFLVCADPKQGLLSTAGAVFILTCSGNLCPTVEKISAALLIDIACAVISRNKQQAITTCLP